MRKIILLFVIALVCSVEALAAPVSLFYIERSPRSVRDFLEHSSQIGLAVPAWYSVDQDGLVSGGPDPLVLDRAKAEKLPVMPLIALFDKAKFHALASNAHAQDEMNQALVRESKLYGYIGIQFDFENIDWKDCDLLSALVEKTAAVLHRNGLQLSIATVPNAPGYPGEDGFSKWIYADWRGAYDLAAIGKAVDLVCLMTYDQHTHLTTPGPVAGWQWTVDNLEYALKAVPAAKLSLGIPVYGYHWYTQAPELDGNEVKTQVEADSISAPDAFLLADRYKRTVQWDEEERTAYVHYTRDQMREWIYFTDARTFAERYELVKKYNLEGFCSWVLGEEDPSIWKLLPVRAK
jgi:spore germination protein YaaH